MRITGLALLASCICLLAPREARAFDFGVGVEGAGTLALTRGLNFTSSTAFTGGFGLELEQRFDLIAVELTIWEDAQTPLGIATGGANPSTYIPVDVGLRLGLGTPLLKPYIGVLVNDTILTYNGGGNTNGNFFGLGGDLGLDIKVLFLRFGVEVRAFWSLTDVAQPPALDAPSGTTPAGALVLQALASARLSF